MVRIYSLGSWQKYMVVYQHIVLRIHQKTRLCTDQFLETNWESTAKQHLQIVPCRTNSFFLKEISVCKQELKKAGKDPWTFIGRSVDLYECIKFWGGYDNTAIRFLNKTNHPLVIKADNLASGKGVYICKNLDESIIAVNEIFDGKFGIAKNILIEEFLKGEEMSFFIISDGISYKLFGTAQDHKRVFEGDKGKNTGGMGAYSPSRLENQNLNNKIIKKIIEPTLKGLKENNIYYKGFLYAGLMISKGEPYLIEYNIRMGDPECQVLMMRLKTDLVNIIDFATTDKLEKIKIKWHEENSITIVLCAKGYPGNYLKNSEIKNLNKININEFNQIFHAGTYEKNNKIFSMGGRVLNITSKGSNLKDARDMSLRNLKKINWEDGFYRKDIGWRAIKEK